MILVAGANGLLGGTVVQRLLRRGTPVRALSRDAARLKRLAAAGAEIVPADMLDRAALEHACAGVTQVVTTANNIMGRGPRSCNRIDERMYQTLGEVATALRVPRIVHVSARNLEADSVVDYFRVKFRVEGIVRSGAVPWVVIRPSAFIDVWAGVVFGSLERPAPVATVFGRGDRVANYIAVDDVVSFILAVLDDPTIEREVIDIGGPSELTLTQLATTIQRARGVPERVRHVPAPVLGIARHAVRPFNEVAARLASLGYWTTLADRPFPGWPEPARRFGVSPVTVEQFAAGLTPMRHSTVHAANARG